MPACLALWAFLRHGRPSWCCVACASTSTSSRSSGNTQRRSGFSWNAQGRCSTRVPSNSSLSRCARRRPLFRCAKWSGSVSAGIAADPNFIAAATTGRFGSRSRYDVTAFRFRKRCWRANRCAFSKVFMVNGQTVIQGLAFLINFNEKCFSVVGDDGPVSNVSAENHRVELADNGLTDARKLTVAPSSLAGRFIDSAWIEFPAESGELCAPYSMYFGGWHGALSQRTQRTPNAKSASGTLRGAWPSHQLVVAYEVVRGRRRAARRLLLGPETALYASDRPQMGACSAAARRAAAAATTRVRRGDADVRPARQRRSRYWHQSRCRRCPVRARTRTEAAALPLSRRRQVPRHREGVGARRVSQDQPVDWCPLLAGGRRVAAVALRSPRKLAC